MMSFGNMPIDGGFLQLDRSERSQMNLTAEQDDRWIRRIYGAAEFIRGLTRYCLWISDDDACEAANIPAIAARIAAVKQFRLSSKRKETLELAAASHRFGWVSQDGSDRIIVLPRISSERRGYIPAGYEPQGVLTTDQAYAMEGAPLWNLALMSSRIHIVWIETVCGKMKTDLRYSNTLGWNTFPVPKLTEQDKADLTRTAENILLAREAHFPATIADLYDPEKMPDDLCRAHDENDEVLERIYIGRRFRNDTERLEKLFDLYTKMTAEVPKAKKGRQAA